VVAKHSATPSPSARIDGFSHLPVGRFLAAYREQLLTPAEIAA